MGKIEDCDWRKMSHLHFSEILMQLSDAAEQFKVFGNSKSVFTIQKGYKMQFLLLPNKDFTNKVCSMHKDIMFLKECTCPFSEFTIFNFVIQLVKCNSYKTLLLRAWVITQQPELQNETSHSRLKSLIYS